MRPSEAYRDNMNAVRTQQLRQALEAERQRTREFLAAWLAEHHPEDRCAGECLTTRRLFMESLIRDYEVFLAPPTGEAVGTEHTGPGTEEEGEAEMPVGDGYS